MTALVTSVAGVLLVLLAAPPDVRNAKALVFDRKFAQARQAWEEVRAAGVGPEAQAAGFWIARCSEGLGEYERALREYGAFLGEKPLDRTLAEEARTSRVGLAARLHKAGHREYLPILHEALTDASKTVRYFAALQLAELGPDVGRAAVPILQKIVTEETDDDLVDRAKLCLLRVDRKALERAVSPSQTRADKQTHWIKVRIYDRGGVRPKVSINLPLSLAEMVFKSLPDDAQRELGRKGIKQDNFWERVRAMGPTKIVDIVGDDGGRVEIWTE
jgi:hypothetical protein